ncbi:MAG: hypothetical protein H6867_03765 [Rhodospirillales bacterium]|nr:hypothetical protein [Rhodospirillales bacterium]MCB9996267.1 hypothetical protein [Rhodospirillales bacterium]
MIASILDSLIPVYTYCENTGGLIAQPLNLLSCAVFWLGAIWMWHKRDEDDESPSFHQVAAVLLFLLGVTGMIWHGLGIPAVLALDMFLLFMLCVLVAVVVANDVLRWDMAKGLIVVVMLIVIGALLKDQTAGRLPQNGGLFLPLLFFLALAALKIQTVNEEVTVYLLSASYTLFFGLLARSVDILFCMYFPLGLHFLWHVLIVISVIYIAKTIAAMKQVPWPEEDPEAKG